MEAAGSQHLQLGLPPLGRKILDRQDAALDAYLQRQRQGQKTAAVTGSTKEQTRVQRAATRQIAAGFSNKELRTFTKAKSESRIRKSSSTSALPSFTRTETHFYKPQPLEHYHRFCAFLPSDEHSVVALLSTVELQSGDTFFDLGCGDGRVVIAVVKKFGCMGVGVDVNPGLVSAAKSRALAEFAGAPHLLDRARFLQEDICNVSLVDARVIFMFMTRDAVETLLSSCLPRAGIQEGTSIYISTCSWDGKPWLADPTGRLHCRLKASYLHAGLLCYEWIGPRPSPGNL